MTVPNGEGQGGAGAGGNGGVATATPPAAAASGGEGGLLGISMLSDPGAAPATPAAGAVGSGGQAGQAAGQVAAPADGGQPPADGSAPNNQAPQPVMLAGRFSVPPEVAGLEGIKGLATAYQQSSAEGRKLFQQAKEYQSQLAAAKAEADEYKAQIAAIPAPKEPTAEEMQTWTPAQAAQYYTEKQFREARSAQDKKAALESKQTMERQARETEAAIDSRIDEMEADTAQFPDYVALQPVMEKIADKYPDLCGRRDTPEILYVIAQGLKAMQGRRAGAEASAAAQKAAADKAAADAALAGSGGASPAGAPQVTTGSGGIALSEDEKAFNSRLISAQPKPVFQ